MYVIVCLRLVCVCVCVCVCERERETLFKANVCTVDPYVHVQEATHTVIKRITLTFCSTAVLHFTPLTFHYFPPPPSLYWGSLNRKTGQKFSAL